MVYLYGICTLPETDSDPNLGTDIRPKIGIIMFGDPDPDWNRSQSPCNGNSFCIVQCSRQIWSPNPK